MEKALERRPWLVPLILAVLTVIVLRPVIIPTGVGHILNGKDLPQMFYLLQGYIRQTLQDGELPLWIPHQFIGLPLIGNPHAGFFYPGMWAVWLIGETRGIGLMMALHVWLGAWGMARLARSFGASRTGALLGGVVYATSGWAAAQFFSGHFNHVMVFGWVPWGLVAYRHALARESWFAVLPGMAVFGLALLAGFTPLMVYLVLGLAFVWAYHVAGSEDPVRAGWSAGLRLGAIVLGGAILAGALVLPSAELTRLAVRKPGNLSFASRYALPPAQVISALAVPGLYGNPTVEPYYYWGANFVEEFTAYAGLLPLLAIPLAFRWPRREVWFFLALIAFGLAMSLGLEGALLPLLVRWVPGFGFFRVPARALLLVVIGLAGLASLLVTALQTSSLEERHAALAPALRVWLPAGAALAFGLAIVFSGWYASASHVEPMPLRATLVAGALAKAGLIACAVWVVLWLWTRPDSRAPGWALGLTAALIVLDAWHVAIPIITVDKVPEAPIWTGARANIPTGPDARVLMREPWTGPINGASVTGHLHVLGYDPLPIDAFDRLQDATDANDPTARVNTLLGVKYVLSSEPYDDPAFELIGIAYDSYYYERVDPFPRAWVASEVVVEPDDGVVREQIAAPDVNMLATAFVDESISCPVGEGGEATITEYGPNDVTLEVSGGGGLLVLSDQYYPGWRATVDGDSAEIVRADTVFRGVCVPPGAHTVRFEYRPRSLVVGVVMTAAGWLAWLIAVAVGWRRGRIA